MLAQIDNVNLDAKIEGEFKFQIHKIWIGKPPLEKRNLNTPRNWENKQGVENFIKAREEGKSTRMALGTKANEITETYGFYIDSDGSLTIGELKKSELWEYILGVQASDSYTYEFSPLTMDVCNKFHGWFIFDKPCANREQHKKITKYIFKEKLNTTVDASVTNPDRIEYGSRHRPIIINLSARFPLDKFTIIYHDFEKRRLKDTNLRIKSQPKSIDEYFVDNNEEKALSELLKDWVYEEIFCNVCDMDITKIFSLYDHRLNKEPSDGSYLQKYTGYNPFSSTNSSGKSFVCGLHEDKAITWNDRKGEVEIIHDNEIKTGGTIFDYFFCYYQKYEGRFLSTTLPDNLYAVVSIVCDHFGVDYPSFMNPGFSWLASQIIKDISNNTFIASWGNYSKEEKTIYFAFVPEAKFYKLLSLKKLADEVVFPRFNQYKAAIKKINEIYLKKSGGEKGFDWSIFIKKFNSIIKTTNTFKIFHQYPKPSLDYWVFQNGVFNMNTKRLEPNYGQALNFSILNFDYIEPNEEIGRAFHFWIDKVLLDNYYRSTFVKNFMILCALNRGFQCASFPYFFGVKGTGKSTPGELFIKIFGDSGFVVTGTLPLNPNNNHASIMLENKSVWVIKELSEGKNVRLDDLLDLYGIDNRNPERWVIRTGNPKGEKPVQFRFYAGLIADSENVPKVFSDKDGIYRRARFLKLYKREFTEEETNNLDYIFQNDKMLFCYWINHDYQTVLNEFKKVYKHPDVLADHKEVVEANSTIPAFFDISLIPQPGNKLDRQIIYDRYCGWCNANREIPLKARHFYKSLKKYLEEQNISVEFDIRSNGKYLWRGLALQYY